MWTNIKVAKPRNTDKIDSQRYIILPYYKVVFFINGQFKTYDLNGSDRVYDRVTWWMPFPDLPKND